MMPLLKEIVILLLIVVKFDSFMDDYVGTRIDGRASKFLLHIVVRVTYYLVLIGMLS